MVMIQTELIFSMSLHNVICYRSPAAGLKQRQAEESTEMDVEPETIEVVDAKGRKQVIEAPIMVPATGEMIEEGGDIDL